MTSIHEAELSARTPDSDVPMPSDRHTRAKGRIESGTAVGIAVVVAITLGALARLIAAMLLSMHVDEPSSILAARSVVERGMPILPSGTAYFQGATLSYLLAPFVWLGAGGLDHLFVMRLPSVIAGVTAVYLSYKLGRAASGEAWIGAGMAALVALDPLSVQWSGHVRMYALLQALTIAIAWVFIGLLNRPGSRGRSGLLVILFWAAVFTHVGAALLLLAMAGSLLVLYRRALFRRGDLLAMLVACGAAPITLLLVNHVFGTASVSLRQESSSPLVSFVGDNLLAPLARFHVTWSELNWSLLIRPSTLFWLVPGLVVALSTVVGGVMCLGRGGAGKAQPSIRNAVVTLLFFYWVPMFMVGAFTISPKERYVLHAHTIGYFFVAMVLLALVRRNWTRDGAAAKIKDKAVAGGVIAVVALVVVSGVVWRLEHPVIHPDYRTAMAYVARHHTRGQPVIMALPAAGYLALDETERLDVYFLAGSQDLPRAQRYTRWDEDGRLIDYWVGAESLVSAEELRDMLEERPDSLLVIDEDRLTADWAYGGEIERVIREMTTPILRTRGGGLVLRVESRIGELDERSA